MVEVTHFFSGDATRLLKAYDDLIERERKEQERRRESAKANKELRAELDRQKESEKELAAEQRKRNRVMEEGRRVTESVQTPLERYNRQVEEQRRLHMAGAISTDTLKRKLNQLEGQYREQEIAVERANRALESNIRSQTLGGQLLTGAKGQVLGLIGAYVGVQEAVQGVVQEIRNQVEAQKESLNTVLEIAKAQQEAAKNLTGAEGLPEVLQNVPRQIQARTGFPSQGQLTEALGQAFSASGDKIASIAATQAAAQLTRLSPADLPTTAAGALDVFRASGVPDIQSALGLVLSAGATSRVVKPERLVRTISPVITAGVNTDLSGDRLRASREASAVFGTLTRLANDPLGEASSTAAITLLQETKKLFEELPAERAKIQGNITKLESKIPVTADEQLAIDKAKFSLEQVNAQIKELGTPSGEEGRIKMQELVLRRRDSELDLANAKAKATLTAEEQQNLTQLKQDLQSIEVRDPGTFEGRRQLVAGNEALRAILFQTPFGERRFQEPFKLLFQEGSPAAQALRDNFGKILPDAAVFSNKVNELTQATPTLSAAAAEARAAGVGELFRANPQEAFASSIRGQRETALQFGKTSGLSGLSQAIDAAVSGFLNVGNLSSDDPLAVARTALTDITFRQGQIRAGGVTRQEQRELGNLDVAIQSIAQTANEFAATVDKLTEREQQALERIDQQAAAAAARLAAAAAGAEGP